MHATQRLSAAMSGTIALHDRRQVWILTGTQRAHPVPVDVYYLKSQTADNHC